LYIKAFLHLAERLFLFQPGLLMRYIFFVAAFLIGNIAFGQNLTGKWLGELPQNNRDVKFKLEIDLVQTGKSLAGTSTFTTVDNHKVVFALQGTIDGKKVLLEEYKGVSCDCESGKYEFCLKKMKGTFTVDSLNTLFVVDGTWTSERSFNGKEYLTSICEPGRFTIVKPAFIRPLDGYYHKNNIANSTKPTAYANAREADVIFAKRVWREIDLREKMNQYLASPKQRLIDVLIAAVQNRDVVAYDPTSTKEDPSGDAFSKRLTVAQALHRLADSNVVDIIDKKTGEKTASKVVAGEFNPDDIVKFRLKEDWLYDKQRGIFEPRIVGIAPLIKIKIAGSVTNNEYQPAFWIYFPEARSILATKEAVNRSSDAAALSFDDVFMKRLFTSYIIKQSNDRDERIRDYTQGIDKLYEGERQKLNLKGWELGLWQY
jgi:gliding motility associated protien GldN